MNDVSPLAALRGLAVTAMIGSDRSGTGVASPGQLLSRAAVEGTRARAGYRAGQYTDNLPVCPDDHTPLAGSAAMATLMRLLASPDAGLIEEWARCARSRGQRVADHVVPLVLDWWCRQPQRAHVVAAVCGKRAHWLASLNDAWQKAMTGEDHRPSADLIWQSGNAAERESVLLAVRKEEPARALSLVQSTWASDSADERRRFVECLAHGLSMLDEPFLETALDDKSKVVRRAAATVLGSLPGSRHKTRMNALARTVIQVEAHPARNRKAVTISLVPPQSFDKAWERDGVEEQVASGKGKRAWWMQQILSGADVSVWCAATGLAPDAVLEAIAGDDYFSTALKAIIQSLRARPDAAWARAVVQRLVKDATFNLDAIAELIESLPPEEGSALALEAAQHTRFSVADGWQILALVKHGWTPAFSAAALKRLRASSKQSGEEWKLYESIDRVSRTISPELAEEFVEAVATVFPNTTSESVRRSIDRARLRADMHKEFAA